VHAPVAVRASGGEADGTRFDRGAQDRGHGVDVVGVRVSVLAFAHHVGAQRGVRHHRADVERARHACQGVEILGERLPVPLDALVQRGAGDVLDAFHELDEVLVRVGPHRREADAAVPQDRGGHAVPTRRREVRIPGGLTVEVRVHVDETGRDQQAVGVELAPPGAVDASHLDDDAVGDRDVGRHRGRAGAVDDGAATDHEVVHQDFLSCAINRAGSRRTS
jgi:hypothetical protein